MSVVSGQVTVQNGRIISLGVWDTAGAERFQSISRMYYRGSKAAIICFNPASQTSFTKALFWVRRIMRRVSSPAYHLHSTA